MNQCRGGIHINIFEHTSMYVHSCELRSYDFTDNIYNVCLLLFKRINIRRRVYVCVGGVYHFCVGAPLLAK